MICASQDAGQTTSNDAFFLLSCSSRLSDTYPNVNITPRASGGDTGSYTLSYSAGVLTIDAAATHDDLTVKIEFCLGPIDNVNIT
jgi:hypothetical protein